MRRIYKKGKWINVPDWGDDVFSDYPGNGNAPSYSPFISLQPSNVSSATGSTISFHSVAGPYSLVDPLFSYMSWQWYQGTSALVDGQFIVGDITQSISGSHSPTLIISNITSSNVGDYAMSASNQYGGIVSNTASLALL